MNDTSGDNHLPLHDELNQMVDHSTGLRPEELNHLRSLTDAQRAAVVVELGGVWPGQQTDETSVVDTDTSLVGDIALDGNVSEATTSPAEDSTETDLSSERKLAIESIAANPAVSSGIDFWNEGAAYSVIRDYKHKHLSDETRDSEKLREDFDTLLLLTTENVKELLPEQTNGYWAAVCKLENEDGVTYKLVMKSPKAVDMRPNVDMMLSIPAASGLQKEISLLYSDPSMLLDLFKAFAKDEVTRLRGMGGPFKVAELAEGVKTPFLLSNEQTTAILEVINEKKKSYNLTDSHHVPPLHPVPKPSQAPTSSPPPRGTLPPPQKRFGWRRK